MRNKIYALIILAIAEKLDNVGYRHTYSDSFAEYIVKLVAPRATNKEFDPVSIISTNWDILLDNSIKRAIENDLDKGVVDYCCYISSLKEDESIKLGLWALGKGKYNVKLLKLHGSMNWLHCPKCQRLFVEFNTKSAKSIIFERINCKYCSKNFADEIEDSILLTSNLIMPTFLKDMTNFQLKLIWQNAGVELSESTKIVFIGYSLPQADFELRQLLSRMVPHDTEIEVIMKKEATLTDKKNNNEIFERYKNFFGRRKVIDYRDGVEDYIKKLV